MTLKSALFNFLINTLYLLKSQHSFGIKIKIWFHYIRFGFMLPFSTKNKLCHVRFLGMRMEAFDLATLYYLYAEIFVKNEYYFTSFKPNPVIFDCGANLGMATIYFKFLYPHSTIQVFEPDPETFALLSRNIDLNNFSGVELHNIALTDQDGEMPFYVSSDPGSLVMSMKKERMEEEERILAIKSQEVIVKTKKLSGFISQPVDFFKIDVEGAEETIMPELVTSKKIALIEELVMEYHHKIGNEKSRFSIMLSLLEKAGYEYQMDMINMPLSRKEVFQDIHLNAYRLPLVR